MTMSRRYFSQITSRSCRDTEKYQCKQICPSSCIPQEELLNFNLQINFPSKNSEIGTEKKKNQSTDIYMPIRREKKILSEDRLGMENQLKQSQKRYPMFSPSYEGPFTQRPHTQRYFPVATIKLPPIKFSYNPISLHQLTKNDSSESCLWLSFKSQQILRQKSLRNKMCNQLNLCINPKKGIQDHLNEQEDQNQHWRSLPNINIINVPQFNENAQKIACVNSSKVASTQATNSFFSESKNTSLSIPQNNSKFREKSCHFLNKNAVLSNQQSNLLVKIPQFKILSKTILFTSNCNQSDFTNQFSKSENPQFLSQNDTNVSLKEAENRHWKKYLKCLVTDESPQNLKESIHCGPDIYNQNFKCELLDNFGRNINESSIQFQ